DFWRISRPHAAFGIVPGVPRKIGDLRRQKAVARRIEQAEILQGVGTDDALGRLDPTVRARWHQLRRNLGGEDVGEDSYRLWAHLAARRDKPNEMLDQRLGNRGVGVVVRH